MFRISVAAGLLAVSASVCASVSNAQTEAPAASSSAADRLLKQMSAYLGSADQYYYLNGVYCMPPGGRYQAVPPPQGGSFRSRRLPT